MCTNVTRTAELTCSSAYDGDDWFGADRAVVYFDHPQDAMVDHALCIDVWADGRRIAVELDAASARRLVDAIEAVLAAPEVEDVLQPLAVAHQRDV